MACLNLVGLKPTQTAVTDHVGLRVLWGHMCSGHALDVKVWIMDGQTCRSSYNYLVNDLKLLAGSTKVLDREIHLPRRL